MRFVLWSGCHWVSDPLTATQISINQKLCGLADLGRCVDSQSWNNSTMEWEMWQSDNDENNGVPLPHCHMLEVSNKVSCLTTSSPPAAFSTFQTNLQRSQLCWYWDTMLQPSITSSCLLSNNLNHNQNIQKSTQSADRTVDMFRGLLMLRLWQNECWEFQSEGCGLLVSHQEILAGPGY